MTSPPLSTVDATQEPSALPPLPSMPPLGASAPTRQQVRRRRVIGFLTGAVWLAAMLVSMGLRPDQGELPWAFSWGLPIAMYLLGFATLGFALAGGSKGTGLDKVYLGKVTAGVALLLISIAAIWNPSGAQSHVPASFHQLMRADLMCGAMTTMLGFVPFLMAVLTLRRAFPNKAASRSILVGLSGGIAGAATVQMHCSVTVSSHMLLAHALPVLIYSVAGAWVAKRVFRA